MTWQKWSMHSKTVTSAMALNFVHHPSLNLYHRPTHSIVSRHYHQHNPLHLLSQRETRRIFPGRYPCLPPQNSQQHRQGQTRLRPRGNRHKIYPFCSSHVHVYGWHPRFHDNANGSLVIWCFSQVHQTPSPRIKQGDVVSHGLKWFPLLNPRPTINICRSTDTESKFLCNKLIKGLNVSPHKTITCVQFAALTLHIPAFYFQKRQEKFQFMVSSSGSGVGVWGT